MEMTLPAACVAAGVLLQAFLLVEGWREYVISSAILFTAIGLSQLLPGAEVVMRTVVVLGIFVPSFALLFRHRVLPVVDEAVILQYTLIFYYLAAVLAAVFDGAGSTIRLVMLYAGIPSALVLLYSFVPWYKPPLVKFILYVWYMIIIAFVLIAQFVPGGFIDLAAIKSGDATASLFRFIIEGSSASSGLIIYLDALLCGMVLFQMLTTLMYLFFLIPLPARHQPFVYRLLESWELAIAMAARFSDRDSHPLESLIIIIGQGGVLLLNFWLQIVDPWTLVFASFVIIGLLSSLRSEVQPLRTGPDL